jgi:hypothetical protein
MCHELWIAYVAGFCGNPVFPEMHWPLQKHLKFLAIAHSAKSKVINLTRFNSLNAIFPLGLI